MHAEIGAFWKILAQQSVGVLVGAALPWAVRIAEIDLDASVDLQACVLSHLSSLIPSQRATHLLRPFEPRQYTSIEFGHRCREAGVRPSMGSVGDAYDNAMCESFFATLECELFERCRFKTQTEARSAVFAFIEGFYNPRRRHSSIGYLSPIDYEHRHHAATVDRDAHQPAAVLAAVKDKPSGGRRMRPSLTATARGSRVSARVGTEEWLRRGPN